MKFSWWLVGLKLFGIVYKINIKEDMNDRN